jgi:phosphoglycerate dehydrogenase-like enzyme
MANYPLVEAGKSPAIDRLKIVTRWDIPAVYQQEIRAVSPVVEFKYCSSEDEFRRELADAHVIYGSVKREDLGVGKQLRWMQAPSAGVEHIVWPELVNSPIVLTNMQRMFASPISETAIGLYLALARGTHHYVLQGQKATWDPLKDLVEISGLTMGIAGLGGIGTEIAYRAHYGFRMHVLAVDPKPLPKPDFVAELHALDWFPEMAKQVDVLVSAAPSTPVSRHMFNESVFRSMKPGAFFINMSRGMLVDTPALVRALKEGWIAGAGLDVTDPEPLPDGHPLWTAGNVIITCHSSGASPLTDPRRHDLFAENVRRYVQGLPLLNVVDKTRGY